MEAISGVQTRDGWAGTVPRERERMPIAHVMLRPPTGWALKSTWLRQVVLWLTLKLLLLKMVHSTFFGGGGGGNGVLTLDSLNLKMKVVLWGVYF